MIEGNYIRFDGDKSIKNFDLLPKRLSGGSTPKEQSMKPSLFIYKKYATHILKVCKNYIGKLRYFIKFTFQTMCKVIRKGF